MLFRSNPFKIVEDGVNRWVAKCLYCVKNTCGIEHGSEGWLVRIRCSNSFDSELAKRNAEFARSGMIFLARNWSVTCRSGRYTKTTSPFSTVTIIGGKGASRVAVYYIITDTFRSGIFAEVQINETRIGLRWEVRHQDRQRKHRAMV